MNSMIKASVAIGAFVAMGVFSTAASAACDSDETTYYTHTGSGTVGDPYVAVEKCRKVQQTGPGVAATSNFRPYLYDHDGDGSTPKVPLIVDGKPISIQPGFLTNNPNLPGDTKVLGTDSSALGSGASVYGTRTVINDGGTPDDPSDDTTSVEYVPVNNSTAIGAGAHADQDNQIVVGTDQETIKAPGITSGKSQARQTGPLQVVTTDAAGNLASDNGYIFNQLGTHNQQIAALETLTAAQGAQINANTALLSEHSARLDTQAKGIAISMALPDTWLSDKERFAVMGNIGGFDGETALGFGAIARIDQTWSLNARFGADVEFEEFGWSVGARAGF